MQAGAGASLRAGYGEVARFCGAVHLLTSEVNAQLNILPASLFLSAQT